MNDEIGTSMWLLKYYEEPFHLAVEDIQNQSIYIWFAFVAENGIQSNIVFLRSTSYGFKPLVFFVRLSYMLPVDKVTYVIQQETS